MERQFGGSCDVSYAGAHPGLERYRRLLPATDRGTECGLRDAAADLVIGELRWLPEAPRRQIRPRLKHHWTYYRLWQLALAEGSCFSQCNVDTIWDDIYREAYGKPTRVRQPPSAFGAGAAVVAQAWTKWRVRCSRRRAPSQELCGGSLTRWMIPTRVVLLMMAASRSNPVPLPLKFGQRGAYKVRVRWLRRGHIEEFVPVTLLIDAGRWIVASVGSVIICRPKAEWVQALFAVAHPQCRDYGRRHGGAVDQFREFLQSELHYHALFQQLVFAPLSEKDLDADIADPPSRPVTPTSSASGSPRAGNRPFGSQQVRLPGDTCHRVGRLLYGMAREEVMEMVHRCTPPTPRQLAADLMRTREAYDKKHSCWTGARALPDHEDLLFLEAHFAQEVSRFLHASRPSATPEERATVSREKYGLVDPLSDEDDCMAAAWSTLLKARPERTWDVEAQLRPLNSGDGPTHAGRTTPGFSVGECVQRGVVVTAVDELLLEAAGLRGLVPGMRITAVNDVGIDSVCSFEQALAKSGDTVTLRLEDRPWLSRCAPTAALRGTGTQVIRPVGGGSETMFPFDGKSFTFLARNGDKVRIGANAAGQLVLAYNDIEQPPGRDLTVSVSETGITRLRVGRAPWVALPCDTATLACIVRRLQQVVRYHGCQIHVPSRLHGVRPDSMPSAPPAVLKVEIKGFDWSIPICGYYKISVRDFSVFHGASWILTDSRSGSCTHLAAEKNVVLHVMPEKPFWVFTNTAAEENPKIGNAAHGGTIMVSVAPAHGLHPHQVKGWLAWDPRTRRYHEVPCGHVTLQPVGFDEEALRNGPNSVVQAGAPRGVAGVPQRGIQAPAADSLKGACPWGRGNGVPIFTEEGPEEEDTCVGRY